MLWKVLKDGFQWRNGDILKLYVKLYFSSESASPLEIIKRVKELDFKPVAGDYDFVGEYEGAAEYAELVGALHRALSGTDTTYRLITRPD